MALSEIKARFAVEKLAEARAKQAREDAELPVLATRLAKDAMKAVIGNKVEFWCGQQAHVDKISVPYAHRKNPLLTILVSDRLAPDGLVALEISESCDFQNKLVLAPLPGGDGGRGWEALARNCLDKRRQDFDSTWKGLIVAAEEALTKQASLRRQWQRQCRETADALLALCRDQLGEKEAIKVKPDWGDPAVLKGAERLVRDDLEALGFALVSMDFADTSKPDVWMHIMRLPARGTPSPSPDDKGIVDGIPLDLPSAPNPTRQCSIM